jgi:hypothetical protein
MEDIELTLLKKPSQYIFAWCVYLTNCIHATYSLVYPNGSFHTHTVNRGVEVPLLIGVVIIILSIPLALRQTSYTTERAILIITGLLLVMCAIGDLHTLGARWAVLPYGDVTFVAISWILTILAGAWLFQVLHSDHFRNVKREG